MNSGLQAGILTSNQEITGLKTKVLWTFGASDSFVCPMDGYYRFYVLGAGGAGGWAHTNAAANALTTGGAGGGFCYKRKFLKKGTVLTVVVGSGSNQPTLTVNTATVGTNGGSSSVSGGGLSLYAGGGEGGKASLNTVLSTRSVGGSASGGDINFKGGDGGTVTAQTTCTWGAFATGGASAGSLWGNGITAADITGTAGAVAFTGAAVGGSSIRFAASALNASGCTGGGTLNSSGVGTGAPASTVSANYLYTATGTFSGGTTSVTAIFGVSAPDGNLDSEPNPFLRLYGQGSVANNTQTGSIYYTAGPGASSGGTSTASPAATSYSSESGSCGGSGGFAIVNGGAGHSFIPGLAYTGMGGGGGGVSNATGNIFGVTGNRYSGRGYVAIEMEL
jgi:hypothetical protein